jgi:hypothetical protein
MSASVRPVGVPDFAVEIPPTHQVPAGTTVDPQQAALFQFYGQVAHENAQDVLVNAGNIADYQANASQRQALGLPPAKQNPLRPLHMPNVQWAVPNGTILHPAQVPGDTVWIWETDSPQAAPAVK